ncbi:MAG: hypothetical protein Q8R18_03460 [bacterium]|nr:hypothetical protein [bacterium]
MKTLQALVFAALTSCGPKQIVMEVQEEIPQEILQGFARKYEECEKLSAQEKINNLENPYLFAQHICDTYGMGTYNTHSCEKESWQIDCHENNSFAFTLDNDIVCYSDQKKCMQISKGYKWIESPWQRPKSMEQQ